MLDNCWGNVVFGWIVNAHTNGFIYGNQPVNASHENTINIMVEGGCSAQGLLVGENCRRTVIFAGIRSVKGVAVNEKAGLSEEYRPSGNIYNIRSRLSGSQSCIVGGWQGSWSINSALDGRGGQVGAVYAIDVYGSAIQFVASLLDSDPWQVRGVVFRESTNANVLSSYTFINTKDSFLDLGRNQYSL